MPTNRIHKQTLIIATVCVLFVGGVFYFTYHGDKPIAPEDQVSIFARYDSSTTTQSTTDWKKQFFAESSTSTITRQNNTDTTGVSDEKLTATDLLGRDFLTQYGMLHQAGLTNNSAMVSSTIATILSRDYLTENQFKEYTSANIKVAATSDDVTLRAYGNRVGLLLKAYSPEKDDAVIALEGMQGKNDNAATILKEHAKNYQIVLDNLLAMSVPQSVAQAHLGLINGASQMIYIANSLSVAKEDPLTALTSLKTYESAFKTVGVSIIYIKVTLTNKNIVYAANEGGSYFNTSAQ